MLATRKGHSGDSSVLSDVRKLLRILSPVHRIDNISSVFQSFRKCFVRREFIVRYVNF
jgi:hypothetical protein